MQDVLHEHEKKLFYSEGDRALEQAAQRVMESPSLEIFKTCLDVFLYNLLEGTYFRRELDLVIS